MPSTKEIRGVEVVVQMAQLISTTSNSSLVAVLTKNGTWHASVSSVITAPTTSTTATPFTRGNSTWLSLTPESIQSWLSGELDSINAVVVVTLEQNSMNAWLLATRSHGLTIAMNIALETDDTE